MERADPGKGPQLLKNQPYDESLEVDGEEVPSVHSPSPRGQRQSESSRNLRLRSVMSAHSSSDEFDGDQKPPRDKEPAETKPRPGPNEEEEEEEEEEDDSDEEDTDDDDDDDPTEPLEGVYNPADYINLPVSSEIKNLFQHIIRYTPQTVELDHSLKPFIPDFIPAVGDIDAFLKVPRPDGKPDDLGLMVLDEPSVKQSDPTVLSLWLSEETKQHGVTQLQKVTSVACPQDNPRAVDSWVDSISALHRSKPPASVRYQRPVPDIDSLMQEWPTDLEDLLGRMQLPPARLDCSLSQYVDIICSLLDIPVHGTRIQSLHLLFSLYLEFRDSQHFTRRT
ncbi:intraflagellar transport protein 46 homolog [Nematolebias whitei]|uniref:intraflagellar transport protein 46 homolog n=1 Tax=Nematolebias whitei TaxID=451745 RepID=UPI0018987998|nr:intraflagellar transport protein 46 homolog [Nematolebias whitei]